MKNLLRLSAALLGFGMLAASACSSCNQPAAETGAADPAMQPSSYVCGAGTHLVGNQCVRNTTPTGG